MNEKGKIRWLISCDESGTGGAAYYGFGTLWMRYQRRGDFARLVRALIHKHSYTGEIKWQKAHSKRYVAFYRELVDFFFRHPWMAFHCIVVRKGWVDKSFHKSYDEARRKHFTKLVENKVLSCIRAHPGRVCSFRVWVDPIASSYKKADEAVEKIANNALENQLGAIRPVESVITKDSKSAFQIQLCDLLLGAVMNSWQQDASSPRKIALQSYIASYLGWSDLKADTYPHERKFNIWYMHDNGPREAETRKVLLKYPLPDL